MATSVLRNPAFLSPKDTLAITSRAPAILKSLLPSAIPLPYPLSLLPTSDSPEKWVAYEHLLLACQKAGDDKSALQCVQALVARFGNSNEHVGVLVGLYHEAVAKSEAELLSVLKDYEDDIAADEGKMRLRKRRVALLKTLGRGGEAMRALVKIVDVSPTDAEAWAELADMYVELGLWDKAVYCLEEVLLIAPNAWNMHARTAEVEWMWAGSVADAKEKTRLVSSSLRRYSRSIELCDDYLRGFYGLKLVCGIYLRIGCLLTTL